MLWLVLQVSIKGGKGDPTHLFTRPGFVASLDTLPSDSSPSLEEEEATFSRFPLPLPIPDPEPFFSSREKSPFTSPSILPH